MGCGGLILVRVVILVGIMVYVDRYMLSEKPLDFSMPEISAEKAASAEAKLKGFQEKKTETIRISEEEANAFFQKAVLPKLIEKEMENPGKGLLSINDDNTIAVQFSLPYSFPMFSEKFLNLHYEGGASIQEGKLSLTDPKKAVVGTFEEFSDEIASFFNTLNKKHNFLEADTVITVENSGLLVQRKKEEKHEAAEKPGDKPADKPDETGENKQQEAPEPPVEKQPAEK
jgi:hypothetical protein